VRIIAGRNQQVARIDYEEDRDVSGDVEQRVADAIGRAGAQAQVLLVSDYLKGVVTKRAMSALVALKQQGAPLLVDPKIPHLECYRGATLVTPNNHEAEVATHRVIRTDADAAEAARDFRARAGCDAVLVTRGEHGMWLSSDEVEGTAPATAREVADVTGAGDTVVATLALALAAGASTAEAAVLANHAAGIVVGKFGPATVTPHELLAAVSSES
jgi:D-beta-D-heptose 7-phosphate kinase/D-beta-D-heptose 1-phosphate adenosyltransferase